jgi:hypothetical protein
MLSLQSLAKLTDKTGLIAVMTILLPVNQEATPSE